MSSSATDKQKQKRKQINQWVTREKTGKVTMLSFFKNYI